QFGAVFGIAIVTAVFNTHGSLAGPAAVTSGYRPALAVAAGLSVLGAVTAIGIRRAAQTGAGRPSQPGPARPEQGTALEADYRPPISSTYRGAGTRSAKGVHQ